MRKQLFYFRKQICECNWIVTKEKIKIFMQNFKILCQYYNSEFLPWSKV